MNALLYVHHSQVYPTAIRAFGVSLCSSAGRIGGMIAPFIAQVKTHTFLYRQCSANCLPFWYAVLVQNTYCDI